MTATVEVLGNTQTEPGFALPAGACDCHTHIFGPAARYPYAPQRGYTPPDASRADMQALHRFLGIERVVIVHPSPYGTDNTVSIDAAAAIGHTARVVAVIDPERATDAELSMLKSRQVSGIRLNFQSNAVGDVDVARRIFRAAAARVGAFGWHIQLFVAMPMLTALAPDIRLSQVPVVIDHFGLADVSRGVGDAGFQTLLALVRDGAATVKLSAGYRVTARADWSDVDPFAAAVLAANADGAVWGSDWPHPGHHVAGAPPEALVPFQSVDCGLALRALRRWCANDAGLLRRVLVDTPARLYGFDQTATN